MKRSFLSEVVCWGARWACVCVLGLVPLRGVAQDVHVDYTRTDQLFANPERGFYSHREVQAQGTPLSEQTLRRLRTEDHITLVARIYYLKSFRNSPLSPAQLDLMQRDFDALRAAGVKAILRFAYSQRETEPDAPLDVILSHLDQIEPLLRANVDVIAVVQAGFIGAWGEWYYSSNQLNNTVARRAVTEKILDVLPAERMVQIRTPFYKKAIYTRNTPLAAGEAFDLSDYARTGHHNDCFLASADDFGTYQNLTADKTYLEADTRYTLMGGETCNPNPPRSECTTALEEMARFHWSYLNRDYHSSVLGSWSTGGCLDEVRRRLGYRFELVDGDYTGQVRPNGTLQVTFRVTNIGWASPYNPRPAEIILRHQQSGEQYAVTLADDPRHWTPGDTTTVTATLGIPPNLPEGTYDTYLSLPDPQRAIRTRPEFAIRLANEGVWNAETGQNDLLFDLTVSAGAPDTPYTGSRWFRPYDQHVSIEEDALPGGSADRLEAYPNPFSTSAHVNLTLARTQPVTIDVFNLLGQPVARLFDGVLPAGSPHLFDLDGSGLPAGTYYVCVRGDRAVLTRSVVVVK